MMTIWEVDVAVFRYGRSRKLLTCQAGWWQDLFKLTARRVCEKRKNVLGSLGIC